MIVFYGNVGSSHSLCLAVGKVLPCAGLPHLAVRPIGEGKNITPVQAQELLKSGLDGCTLYDLGMSQATHAAKHTTEATSCCRAQCNHPPLTGLTVRSNTVLCTTCTPAHSYTLNKDGFVITYLTYCIYFTSPGSQARAHTHRQCCGGHAQQMCPSPA